MVWSQCSKEEKECFGIRFFWGGKKLPNSASHFCLSRLGGRSRAVRQTIGKPSFCMKDAWTSMKSRASLRRQALCSICDCELLAQSGASTVVWSHCNKEEKECFGISFLGAKKTSQPLVSLLSLPPRELSQSSETARREACLLHENTCGRRRNPGHLSDGRSAI